MQRIFVKVFLKSLSNNEFIENWEIFKLININLINILELECI